MLFKIASRIDVAVPERTLEDRDEFATAMLVFGDPHSSWRSQQEGSPPLGPRRTDGRCPKAGREPLPPLKAGAGDRCGQPHIAERLAAYVMLRIGGGACVNAGEHPRHSARGQRDVRRRLQNIAFGVFKAGHLRLAARAGLHMS
nr:hypothetical protein [Phenylobacterium sp.]